MATLAKNGPDGQGIMIEISIADQQLRLTTPQTCIVYPISTALNGVGEQENSGCTPRGWHRIAARIGGGLPQNAVFVGRRFTGELYSTELATRHPARDWILTRILWLQGMEIGFNRMGRVDSMRRYIYIHGTPDSEPMGIARSHGCIRMRNQDVLALFDQVSIDTPVWIQPHSFSRIPCRELS
ncbi:MULTISPECIES: L,D-transpeptidase [unclassified Oceanobacter]|jgi:lipoprotein-anchoring transpeptidase ErfK/SrfK|uniref:L,D-transpeptidase n=2 Tax=Oceanobacter TaxID=196079 RepID=UPI0026E1C3C0|nr:MULTISPECIES: L,D-transpeptidase [unclassified Oceanobacter]MDP2506672.1 L,D-transpeptidase [Oceanobacter sp. 3_MG-2023]MDP2548661.1 L,D-transpeptidase [Oceanobacter sp. 4_MG-2023]